MKWTALSLTFFVNCTLMANIGPAGFGSFMNEYFIETGTAGGNAISQAVQVGFKKVKSVESQIGHVNFATLRFVNNSNVSILHGDSSKDLWGMIRDITAPATFWLDAHVYPPREDGGKNCPLLEELEQIKWHPIKNHTILIDDMHCAGTDSFDFLTKDDLIRKIHEINPAYQISYVDGGDEGEYKDNIMVATIPSS